jgi:hypothetical protein
LFSLCYGRYVFETVSQVKPGRIWRGIRGMDMVLCQLYRGCKFYWLRKQGYPEKTTDLSQVTKKLYDIMLYGCHQWRRNCLPFRRTWVHPRFLVVYLLLHISLYIIFCWSLFVLLYFFFWPLCCMFFFDIRILITPLVSFDHCVVCSSSIYAFW